MRASAELAEHVDHQIVRTGARHFFCPYAMCGVIARDVSAIRPVLTLEFYVADRVAVQLNRPNICESVAAFRRVDVRGRDTTQAAQNVPAIGIGERRRANIAKTVEHVQLHTHVRHRLSSERCRFEDHPRKCRSVDEQITRQMRPELRWINDDVNVAVGVASCRNCGDTRLIGSGDLHAEQSTGRYRKTVTAVRAGADGTDALS